MRDVRLRAPFKTLISIEFAGVNSLNGVKIAAATAVAVATAAAKSLL